MTSSSSLRDAFAYHVLMTIRFGTSGLAWLFTAATLFAGPAAAQQAAAPTAPTTLQGALANDVGTLSDKFTGLAKAMTGKYDWRPGQGVRSVGEVFNLIVGENKMLTGILTGAPNPGGRGNPIADPAQLVRRAEAGGGRALRQRPEDAGQDLRARHHQAGGGDVADLRPARASWTVDRLRAQQ
jgi:hypothetical protein